MARIGSKPERPSPDEAYIPDGDPDDHERVDHIDWSTLEVGTWPPGDDARNWQRYDNAVLIIHRETGIGVHHARQFLESAILDGSVHARGQGGRDWLLAVATKCHVDENDLHAWIETLTRHGDRETEPTDVQYKSGRPRTHDPYDYVDAYRAKVAKLGVPSADNSEGWRTKADVGRLVQDLAQREERKIPEGSTLKRLVDDIIELDQNYI